MSIDPRRFKRALGQFATGVSVVTTRGAAGKPLGLTVNAFCSVSLAPPLVLISIDNRSETNAGFQASRVFAVSVLSEHQEHWSRRFAVRGDAKFHQEALATSQQGLVLIPGALAYIECRVRDVHPAGDHTLYVGEVEALSATPGRPLVYHGSRYSRLDQG